MKKTIALLTFGIFLALPNKGFSADLNRLKPKADRGMWLYFDLGDTIIRTGDLKHIRYFEGVREYMHTIRKFGFKIGIITNIPESWGIDYDKKLVALKKVIADGWDEREPFDWEVFDQIILPLKDKDLKPAPTLFLEAIQKAQGCPSAYIGESPKEAAAAQSLGMAAKLFVPEDPELYIMPAKAKEFLIKNYHLKYDPQCLQARQ